MNLFVSLYLAIISLLGFLTLALLPIMLPRWVKLGIGPAVGIILATEITAMLSLIFSFTILTITISLFLYIFVIFYIFLIQKKRDYIQQFSFKLRYLKKIWPLIIISLSLGSLIGFIYTTKILAPSAFGLTTGGGGLYADTALHSAYTTSIVYQGMPSKNSLFASIPLVYPFLVDFFAATLVKMGANLRFAFILPQLCNFVAVVILLYLVARRFTSNLGALLAQLIFFLGWGLGFTQYLQDVITTHSFTITREYTNNLPGFNLHNVLTGLILPERSFLPGLVIGLLITLLMVTQLKKSSRINSIIIGVLLGILPLWHTHTFIFFATAIGIWYLFSLLSTFSFTQPFRRMHESKAVFFNIVTTFVTALLLAVPVLLWFHNQISHTSFISIHLGWLDSAKNPLWFWWLNSGLLIPLGIIGVILLKKSARVFFLPALIVFILANVIIFQPWDWDNIKLFSWVFLFVSLLAGHALSKLFSKNVIGKIVTVIFLLTLTASGSLSLILLLQQNYTIYDHQDLELADWVIHHTNPNDVFLIDPQPTHPIPGLTGRSVYLGYPGHLWVHGIDYGQREAAVRQILLGNLNGLSQTEVPISYLVVATGDKARFNKQPLFAVYENQKYALFQVRLDK